jgi:diacylglycerol kinase family enzyme
LPIKGLLFLNRSSGAKLPPAEVDALRHAATEERLEIVELSPEVDIRALVRERLARGANLVIAAGGDGTIHHVVQAVVHTEAILGVIPIGTYNHFARDLGIPLDWREALAVACSGDLRQVDTARINERFFVNNISIGLYPELVARREERGRDYSRWKARLYALWVTLRKYPYVAVTVEAEHHHEVIRTPVFMISNNAYDLSRIGIDAPRDTLTEGHLSVYWIPHLSRWKLTTFASRFLAGRLHAAPGFRSFRTVRVRIASPRPTLKVGIDGELFRLATPLVLTSVPQSLVVRVPR